MSLPYFPMYPSDFEAKTSHLTLAEDGAYNRLLRITWMTSGCTIPDDDTWIMRRLRCSKAEFDAVVRIVMDEYFISKDGRLINEKLLKIYIATNAAHQKRVNAGAKGGKAKALQSNDKPSSNAVAMAKQPEPEPEPLKRDTKVSTKKPARRCRIPEDAVISVSQIKAATEKRGHSMQEAEAQFSKFKNDALAKGKMFVNWDRAFVTWLDSEYFRLILSNGGQNNGTGTNNHTSNSGDEEAERTRRIVTAAARGTSTQDWAT